MTARGLKAMVKGFMFHDAETANRLLDVARGRAAVLENAVQAATRLCYLRRSGFCYDKCMASVLCEAEGLNILAWGELPSEMREVLGES